MSRYGDVSFGGQYIFTHNYTYSLYNDRSDKKKKKGVGVEPMTRILKVLDLQQAFAFIFTSFFLPLPTCRSDPALEGVKLSSQVQIVLLFRK